MEGSDLGVMIDNASQPSLLHEQKQPLVHNTLLETACSSGPLSLGEQPQFYLFHSL